MDEQRNGELAARQKVPYLLRLPTVLPLAIFTACRRYGAWPYP